MDIVTLLKEKRFFIGTVMSVDPGTYSVQIFPRAVGLPGLIQGIPISSCLANLFGFKDCALPQAGSDVLCFQHDDVMTCLILGVLTKADFSPDGSEFPLRTVIGAGDGNADSCNIQGLTGERVSKIVTVNNRRPTDVLPGEHVIVNDFGILLGLFQNFASLKASELAQVQAFVFDDLVRIVSHNYQHFTCMGETQVIHDGSHLNTEVYLTHDPIEAQGTPNTTNSGNNGDNSPIEHTGRITNDDADHFYKLKKENQIGISRLKLFVGALGDFVRLMITKPADGQLRALDGQAIEEYDKGLAEVKMSLDGGIYARSLKGVAIEKSNWIRVPTRINSPAQPAINEGSTGETLNTADFNARATAQTVEAIAQTAPYVFDDTARSLGQPYLYFLQLKDYLAYTQESVGYGNFEKNNDFNVPASLTTEQPLDQITEVHPAVPATYLNRKAGVYVMPNGGITLMDAWGSAIVMEGGNIYLQSAKDVVMQPMRNLAGKVGNCLAMAVKNDIELSSTDGNLRIKTDKVQHFYSANSGIILQSDSQTIGEYGPQEDDKPITEAHGIILLAKDSTIASSSQYRVEDVNMVYDLRTEMEFHEVNKQYIISCNGGMDIFSKNNILLASNGSLVCFSEGSALFTGMQSTIIGIKNQVHAVSLFGPVQGAIDATDSQFQTFRDSIASLINLDFTEDLPIYSAASAFDKLLFRFPDSINYKFADGEVFPQTIAQQEDEAFDTFHFGKWQEKAVNDTYPYPGLLMAEKYATAILNNQEFNETDGELYSSVVAKASEGKLSLNSNVFVDYTSYGK
jgi:hypothetical protein